MRRVSPDRPCVICGGHDRLARGLGIRCYGYASSDGAYAHCTRPEKAGEITLHPRSFTYPHRLDGSCRCGRSHAQAAPAIDGPREQTRGRASNDQLGEIVERYIYRDERTRPVHATLRYEPKTFRQVHWVHGTWHWGLGGVRPVLYHLPELLRADPAQPVWITEGESDCERLLAHGLVATTNACGTAWRSHYAEWLRGRQVVIVEDNDDPGRERTARLTAALHAVVASVRVVAFSSMPEHSDVSDWLRAGGNPRRLLEAVAS